MKIAQPSDILVYLPLYLAIENTNHELLNYGNPKEAIKAILKNEADLSIGDPFMFNYIDYKKSNLIIIGGFIKKVLHSLITFSPFIKDLTSSSLKGKTLVSYPEPSTSFFLSNILKKKYSLGNIIRTPFNTELGPLLTLEADLAVILEPNTTYALKNGAKELTNFSSLQAVTTAFCITKDLYIKNKKAIQELLSSIAKGLETFYIDKEKSLKLAKKYFPLVNESILKESLERIRKADIYCKDLSFTDKEILEGLKLRNIDLKLNDVKKFIV